MRKIGEIQLYPFLRIALFLIAGIIVGDVCSGVVSAKIWQWAFVAMWLIAVAMWMAVRRWRIRTHFFAKAQTLQALCLVAVFGACRISHYEEAALCRFTGCEESFKAVVATTPIDKQRSVKCELIVVDGRMKGKRVNAYFQKSDGKQLLSIGDGIDARAVFDEALATTQQSKSNFNYQRFLLVRGISARVFLSNDSWRRCVVDISPLPATMRLKLRLQYFREQLLAQLRRSGISPDAYATIAAMTLGDKTAISDDLREAYSKAGASHVLALSGLHIGIIYAFLMALLGNRRWRYNKRRNMVRTTIAITAIWLFAFMVGLMPSVVRSATMFTIYALVVLLTRDDVALNTICSSATLMLACSPAALWDIGFQMSFLSVLSIVLCRMRIEDIHICHKLFHKRWRRAIFSFVFVSLSAQIAVMPLVAYSFGNIPVLFLIANIVALPLATLIIYIALFLFIISPLCAIAPFLYAVWQWAANMLGLVATLMNRGMELIASLPCASINGIQMSMPQLFFVYALIIVVWRLSGYLGRMYISRHGVTLTRRDYSGREIWE